MKTLASFSASCPHYAVTGGRQKGRHDAGKGRKLRVLGKWRSSLAAAGTRVIFHWSGNSQGDSAQQIKIDPISSHTGLSLASPDAGETSIGYKSNYRPTSPVYKVRLSPGLPAVPRALAQELAS